jgi:hypothetical protein
VATEDEARPFKGMVEDDRRPVPDPTVLTTQALYREVSALQELIEQVVKGTREVIDQQFYKVEQQFELVERQRVEQKKDCVEASTPVLCADLTWRPAGSLVPGDELVTVDDEASTEPGTRCPRRFRRGVVVANALEADDLLCIAAVDGAVLCNAHHRFLKKRNNRWYWTRADELAQGDELLRPVDVWETAQDWQDGWLAGILDGEGCLHIHGTKNGNLARISIAQTEGETADLIEETVGARVAYSRHSKPVYGKRDAPQMRVQIDQRAEIMRLLGSVRPPRLFARQAEVWEGQSIGGKGRATTVETVTKVGRGTIAMLSVSTGTYIASGFASHNTKDAVDAALTAQKEAVREQTSASERSIAKSEAATNKQLEQLATTFLNTQTSLQARIDELKERIVDVDRKAEAIAQQKAGAKDDRTGLYALIGTLSTVFFIGLAVFTLIATRGH